MDQVRKNEIVAVILFSVSLFLFLSIFTFSEQDLSIYTSDPNMVAQNATGVVGSFIGGVLVFLLGNASYVIPILVLVWGLSRILQAEPAKLFLKVFGTIVLVTAVSASLSMISDSSRTLAFSSGGLVGSVVSEFLLEYLGRVGATVFIAAMILLSVLAATEFLILPILLSVFRILKELPGKLREMVPEREERSGKKSTMQNPIATAREGISKKLDTMKVRAEEARRAAEARREVLKSKQARSGEGPRIVSPKRPEETGSRSQKPARVAPVSDKATGGVVDYNMPTFDVLRTPKKGNTGEAESTLKTKAAILERTLFEFGVEAKVVAINKGPVITMYELEPAVGTKVNRITSLSDNISLAMRSTNIRIVAPLPGKGTIGIEVPNDKKELVLMRDIMETSEYANNKSPLKFAIGKDLSGEPLVPDLAKMPHLLIAGATGAGKTVCINCIITSFLLNATPDEIRFIMVDPKRVELMPFSGIPHLAAPIVTNPKKAASALNWAVNEMERRYEVFSEKRVRNISSYKEQQTDEDENLPYIVVIVDELADLMMVAQQDVEGSIMRLAQLSRAAGIHMILATQRPSVNVITGSIKANFPSRISFKVSSKVDSRTVLDANGAEKLLGRGDMLLMLPGSSSIVRGQCSLVEDSEIKTLVKHIKNQTGGPQYIESAVKTQENKPAGAAQNKDDLYEEAVQIVLQTKRASVSTVQRRLSVGYTRAARMIDVMEAEGIVGPYNGSKPREILIESLDDISPEEE